MTDSTQRVIVVNFDVSFGNLVMLFVKSALAAIPAMIILVILGAIAAGVLGGIFGGFGHH
ncbi:MAG: hypothetical protein JSR73_10070 [Proteobacteria bacterium]|nr:hypothetical protein [Pseudomonadota bacterium]